MKLTSIEKYTEDKEGNPLKTKDGRAYTRVVIEVEGVHAGKKLSGFEGYQNKDWKVGDDVEIEIEQKGEYWNFRVPNKNDKVTEKVEEILNKLTKLDLMLTKIGQHLMPPEDKVGTTDIDYPEDKGDVAF